tara:strand:+ start:1978 stop:2142 length:165 start_codon:yes stop_codon:yes gene_type:complete
MEAVQLTVEGIRDGPTINAGFLKDFIELPSDADIKREGAMSLLANITYLGRTSQ